MNARELKQLLRRQTGCSKWRMIVQDRNYDALRYDVIHTLIRTYREDQQKYSDEEWDCDDIARDFWCFAKRVLSDTTEENGIVGRVIFPNHAEIIFVEAAWLQRENINVHYIDQRDWSIRLANKKPKWIEL